MLLALAADQAAGASVSPVMRMIIYVHLVIGFLSFAAFAEIGGFRGLASNCSGRVRSHLVW
jgi:hypothetical protein